MQRILNRNKRLFLKYNAFRRELFAELAPKESETILYLLPWLLSVNDPKCPGYVADAKAVFRVYGVDSERGVRQREAGFKRIFGIQRSGSLLRYAARYYFIEGLYTIGSVGTVSQTSASDCDIWICIDKQHFDRAGWQQLDRKVNLIKDWLDGQFKMPVYFFISDIGAIREGRFGSVDSESSGSTQKDVLKEEFYRSFILICGKVPLWWLCHDRDRAVDYGAAAKWLGGDPDADADLVDLGNLDRVERGEYFGAALWLFHKSLTNPLKSIIKMILLKMLLEAPQERLLCHEFRDAVLGAPAGDAPPDHSLFTMARVLEHMRASDPETLQFLTECFYLRCEINPYNRRQPIKNRLAAAFFRDHPLSKTVRDRLRHYGDWDIGAQIDLGNRLFKFLVQLYREMSAAHSGATSESNQRDLTILGRRISVSYLPKEFKVPVLHKPTASLNLSHLTLSLEQSVWQLYPGNNFKQPLASHSDALGLIGFMVWNGLFSESLIRMRPNASSITLQEVLNLGRRIRDLFGIYDGLDIPYAVYLQPEHISRLLIVAGFERSPWEEAGTIDFRVVYQNCWGELFVRHFAAEGLFAAFLNAACRHRQPLQEHFYVRRHHTTYEKVIERTRQVMAAALGEAGED